MGYPPMESNLTEDELARRIEALPLYDEAAVTKADAAESMRIRAAEVVRATPVADTAGMPGCRVFWGSHGCDLVRGHMGPHVCQTCWDENGDNEGYVGVPPYYGPQTNFYGEDAALRTPKPEGDR